MLHFQSCGYEYDLLHEIIAFSTLNYNEKKTLSVFTVQRYNSSSKFAHIFCVMTIRDYAMRIVAFLAPINQRPQS